MPTSRRFFAALALALGVIVVFNVFLGLRVDSVANGILREMRAAPRIDCLFLGDSLMASGLHPDVFEKAWPPASSPTPKAFNAGLGSSSAVEHYILAHQAYLKHPAVPVLVYGFHDLQLTRQEAFGWGDLVGNRSMGYALEPSTAASLYAPGSLREQFRFHLIGAVPMLRDHSQLWKFVEVARRRIQEIGMPKAKTNEFGRVSDFDELGFPDREKFRLDCETAVAGDAPFVPAMDALLRLAREKGSRVVVVEMPMTPAHQEHYYASEAWRGYRDHVKRRLEAGGVLYVQASDWVSDDACFNDALHLNGTGATLFSTKLAKTMGESLPRP